MPDSARGAGRVLADPAPARHHVVSLDALAADPERWRGEPRRVVLATFGEPEDEILVPGSRTSYRTWWLIYGDSDRPLHGPRARQVVFELSEAGRVRRIQAYRRGAVPTPLVL